MMTFLPYILFLIGFPLLIKGADLLVDVASSLARRFYVSDLVIGLTVVAFGTSSPELFVNVISSLKGNTDIAIANVLGSNIANIFLILGVASIIYPLSVSEGTVWKEIPLALLAAALAGILVKDQLIDRTASSVLSRIDGLVLLAFFIVFLYYSFSIARTIEGMGSHVPSKQYTLFKSVSLIFAGLAGLVLGGKWIVDGAAHMALKLGLSQPPPFCLHVYR
ncbi:MAG: sodium:calcium antiporter [Deltaproteobacteria bacterium]|nr:sodium:calcium antiporter [Deltaproteobacteria bacterium]